MTICQRFPAAESLDALFFHQAVITFGTFVDAGGQLQAGFRFAVLFACQAEWFSCCACVCIVFGIVRHIFPSTDIRSILFVFSDLMVGRLDIQLCLWMLLKPAVILFAFIPGVNRHTADHFPGIGLLQARHEGDQRLDIAAICRYIAADNKFAAGGYVDIVSGFQLTVAHVILFHVHKGRIMVCLAIAVALLSANTDMLAVFLEPFQTFCCFLI